MNSNHSIQLGIYEHYKGNRYEVIGVGRHTETEELFVMYKPLYESDVPFWVRPYDMFFSSVLINGVDTPRFKKVEKI